MINQILGINRLNTSHKYEGKKSFESFETLLGTKSSRMQFKSSNGSEVRKLIDKWNKI